MNTENSEAKKKFETLFAAWVKVTEDPNVRASSDPRDYADNEPFRDIVAMGRKALPFLMEKLEQGVFLLNQAVLDITGIKMDQEFTKGKKFISEQEKSMLLLDWWKLQR
jgi:hypothetical protein